MQRRVKLGLDLQGGSSLLLEVDLDNVITDRLNTLLDSVRSRLRAQDIELSSAVVQEESITVFLADPADIPRAEEEIQNLASLTSRGIAITEQRQFDITSSENEITLTLSRLSIQQKATDAITESIEIIRRRIDETGVNEPTIVRHGTNRILVQLPGLDDPQRIKELLGRTAKMTFRLIHPDAATYRGGRVPPGAVVLEGTQINPRTDQPEKYLIRKRIEVDGARLIDAQPSTDPQTGEWVVLFEFDSIGTRRFAQVTRNNVNRPFAIVLDDQVISAPVIREPILAGRGQISGQFTVQSATDLAVLLRAGALPAPLVIVEERTVGPDLGADAIRAGVIACIVGFILVIIYMVVFYGLFGVMSSIALIITMFLVISILTVFQATLTLPGIAGLLLTLGMSVDANILNNERIREETRKGKSPYAAMEAGFRRAFGTILDSNVTTLITMVLLYTFGSGPVRGFALTLSCGILATLFTAMLLVRLMMTSWLRWKRIHCVTSLI